MEFVTKISTLNGILIYNDLIGSISINSLKKTSNNSNVSHLVSDFFVASSAVGGGLADWSRLRQPVIILIFVFSVIQRNFKNIRLNRDSYCLRPIIALAADEKKQKHKWKKYGMDQGKLIVRVFQPGRKAPKLHSSNTLDWKKYSFLVSFDTLQNSSGEVRIRQFEK